MFSLLRADSDVKFEVDSVNSITFYKKRQQRPAGRVYSTVDKTGITMLRIFGLRQIQRDESRNAPVFALFYCSFLLSCRLFMNVNELKYQFRANTQWCIFVVVVENLIKFLGGEKKNTKSSPHKNFKSELLLG